MSTNNILLRTQKVIVQQRYYTKKNGEHVTYELRRLSFPFLPAGTVLYAYGENMQQVLLTETPKEGKRELKRITVREKRAIRWLCRNITIGDLFPPDVESLNIIQTPDGYLLRPATTKDVRKYAKVASKPQCGRVTYSRHISLVPYSDFLFSKNAVEVESVIQGTASFLRIYPVDAPTGLPNRKVLSKQNFERHRITAPVKFRNYTGIQPNDVLPVWLDEERHCVVVEGKPGVCSVSGEEIRRYHDAGVRMMLEAEYADVLPDVRKTLYNIKERSPEEKLKIALEKELDINKRLEELLATAEMVANGNIV